MTWDPDPLLADEWPNQWAPLNVEIRPYEHQLDLVADGHLDEWTVGALVRNLTAAYEPSFAEIHLDLGRVSGREPWIELGLSRCRRFAEGRGVRITATLPWSEAQQSVQAPVASTRSVGASVGSTLRAQCAQQ